MNHAQKARLVVVETLHRLPEALKKAARQVPVCFEDRPSDALVEDGLDAGILGLFVGAPHHEHANDAGPPPQILLYLENILLPARIGALPRFGRGRLGRPGSGLKRARPDRTGQDS
jgi:predicted Zn-dependent protease with MMP-like domain